MAEEVKDLRPDLRRAAESAPTTSSSSTLLFYLRLALGIGLIVILLRLVDLRELAARVASARIDFLGLGLGTIAASYLLMSYKWALILWSGSSVPFAQVVRFYLVSFTIGSVSPSNISQEVLKIYFASRCTSDLKGSISSVAVNRIIGVFSAAVVTMASFLILQQTEHIQIAPLVSAAVFGVLAVSIGLPILLQSDRVMRWTRALLGRFEGRVIRALRAMLENFDYRKFRHTFSGFPLMRFTADTLAGVSTRLGARSEPPFQRPGRLDRVFCQLAWVPFSTRFQCFTMAGRKMAS